MSNVVLLSRVLFISLLAYAANKVAASKMQVARQSENVESTFQNNYSRIIPGTILRERIKAFEAATELLANYKTLSMKNINNKSFKKKKNTYFYSCITIISLICFLLQAPRFQTTMTVSLCKYRTSWQFCRTL